MGILSKISNFFAAKNNVVSMIFPQNGRESGSPVFSDWGSYDVMVKEGYIANGVVYACVNKIARAIETIPWHIYDRKTGEIATDHHIEAILTGSASPMKSFTKLTGDWATYMMIFGNSYLWRITVDNNTTVTELHNIRPDRMLIIPGGRGILAYRYDPDTATGSSINLNWLLSLQRMSNPIDGIDYKADIGNRAIDWPVDILTQQSDILHSKFINPLDDFYGLSPIKASGNMVDLHNAFTAWNKTLMDNDARPSGVVISKQRLSDPEFKQMKLRMADNMGALNTAKAMIMDSDVTWQQLGMSPKEIDFLAGQNASARNIANDFGVPPSLVNIEGNNTFSNKKEDNQEFWNNTVIPLAIQLQDDLNRWLLAGIPHADRFIIKFDASLLPAMIMKRANLWELANKMKGILTTNEIRMLVGYGKVKGGDVIVVSANSANLEDVDDLHSDNADDNKGWEPDEGKPFVNEHSCRIKDPAQFNKFRRENNAASSNGKRLDFIFGIKNGKSQLQAIRYPKSIWTQEEARKHCAARPHISFEAAKKKQ